MVESYLEYMEKHGHEQLVLFADEGVGLRGAIAIHDTTLGPAVGGLRIWPHESEAIGLLDVLRLSEAMTYKSAAAGLDLGGGKAIVIGDPVTCKTEGLLRAVGRQVESLGGRYITVEDVGSSPADMERIRKETDHVTGLSSEMGGSGDPAPMTSYGVYQAMLACAQRLWSSDDLNGSRIVIQGLGKVGSALLPYLKSEGAVLFGTDLDQSRLERAEKQFGLTPVRADQVFTQECDFLVPCALGGAINDETVPSISARVVCGAANNQLLEPRHAADLAAKDVLYAPDYIVNAGGVINLSYEVGRPYSAEAARRKTGQIYHTLNEVFARADRNGTTTVEAADSMARARIDAVRNIRMASNTT